jgi:UDP-N-acetylglucosamine 4,6-dehydratase/5-epimerase
MMNTKKILIIGGTGSWGQALTKRLLSFTDPKTIIIFSRAERTQFEMSERINDSRVRYEIGDIRDKARLQAVMNDCTVVYHLAALKHVPICEENPIEAIKTNILGLQNSIECFNAMDLFNKKFVYLSTDKAVEPMNTYGLTKSIAEKMVSTLIPYIQYVIVRTGNVLGTNGSIVPKMVRQAKEGKLIWVTHPGMTRFFINIESAVAFLDTASELEGLQIPIMKSFWITDLANIIADNYGAKIEYSGIRVGERLYEKLTDTGLKSCDNVSSKAELKEMIKEWLV